MDGLTDWEDGHEEAHVLLRPICTALHQVGVLTVEVEYSGYGDEGAISLLTFHPEGVEVSPDLEERIWEWAFEALPEGFEVNDGGQGKITIDVANATARIKHEWNILTTESETYEIG